MMRWLWMILMLFGAPAIAQTVQVTSGEHEGFTRIVLTLPEPDRWLLGRTKDGYALRLQSPKPFDLSRAFDRIGQNRLSSISADPVDGSLRLSMNCACHAMPFEFRDNIVVIDLRDGPPPPGSSFELGLDGAPLAPLLQRAGTPPDTEPSDLPDSYSWLHTALDGRWTEGRAPARSDPLPVAIDLATLRQALIADFSRAASQGLVDAVLPESFPPQAEGRTAPAANLRIGETLTSRPVTEAPAKLTEEGARCPDPSRLTVEDWAGEGPVAAQLFGATADIVGEFDTVDPEGLSRAVRLFLHFGFGAEAALLIRTMESDDPDVPYWKSMARVVDGQTDPDGPFAALSACDGPAAYWAVLATGRLLPQSDRDAVLRTFSTLPAHLRRAQGPDLAGIFLANGDRGNATNVLNALLRLPGPATDETMVLAARLATADGDAPLALESLDPLLADPGPADAAAMVALVDALSIERRSLDPSGITNLKALLEEAESTGDAQPLRRSLVIAHALASDFDAAFAELPKAPEAAALLWDLLADGPDSAILTHAIGADPETVATPARQKLAERLAGLGFVKEATRWSDVVTLPAERQDATNRAILARDWNTLPPDAPAPWLAASAAIRGERLPGTASLETSRRLLDESAKTRSVIEDLLGSVPVPSTVP